MSDPDDDEHGWKERRRTWQAKRKNNQIQSTELLRKNQIDFTVKNNGIHLVIHTRPVIDFYPSTGLWMERGTGMKRRGVFTLLKHIGKKEKP